MLSAEIIAIGSELLTPTKTDTNSLWLTEKLNDIGIEVMLKTIVGDDGARLEEAVRDAMKRSDVVITTGGLGPTEDDITREFTARAVDRNLIYHDEIEVRLRERFRLWGRDMPDINKRQAFVIDGAEILPNPNGSAVGMLAEIDGKLLIVLPGPPRENQPMFLDHAFARLKSIAGEVYVNRRILKVSGLGESAVDEVAAPIYKAYPTVQTSILFNKSEVEIHVAARASDPDEAERTTDELAGKLAEALGTAVFSTSGETMEAVVGRLLLERGQTVAVAESCTGGSDRPTDHRGRGVVRLLYGRGDNLFKCSKNKDFGRSGRDHRGSRGGQRRVCRGNGRRDEGVCRDRPRDLGDRHRRARRRHCRKACGYRIYWVCGPGRRPAHQDRRARRPLSRPLEGQFGGARSPSAADAPLTRVRLLTNRFFGLEFFYRSCFSVLARWKR